MNNHQKIFIVIPDDGAEIDDIEAVFDSREKAEGYNKRYKTDSRFEIMERVFDPNYESDLTKDPYRVTLHHDHREPIWVNLHHHLNDIQAAKEERYEIDGTLYSNYDAPIFRILLFAESEEAALRRALEIRDDVVESGEWQQAVEQYKIAKANQPKQNIYRSKREKELEKWLLSCIAIFILMILSIAFLWLNHGTA